MEIAHVHHYYYPFIGGLENVVYNLAREQSALGYKVSIYTSDRPAPRGVDTTDGFIVRRLRSIQLKLPDLIVPLEYPKKTDSIDIIHSHSQNSLFNYLVTRKLSNEGKKTVYGMMAVDTFSNHPNLVIRTIGPAYGSLMIKLALKIADVILCKNLRDYKILVEKYGVKNVKIIPDGIHRALLEFPRNIGAFRNKLSIDKPIILYIGRLHPLKGIEVLLEAAKKVLEKRDVYFVFIGPGNARIFTEISIRLGIADRTKFLGRVDEETKIKAIDDSLALVLPSLSDNVEVFPTVISEAWARKKPVIGSDAGGIPYRIRDGIDGLVTKKGDPHSLSNAIIKLVDHPLEAEKMGMRGFENIKDKTWDRIAQMLIETYESLLSK